MSIAKRMARARGAVGKALRCGWFWLGALAFAVSFALFSHPDLWETANHSYIFLQCLFSGRAGDFYAVVARHENALYYLNGANYNIAVYALFGVWELPVFLFHCLSGTAVSEVFLIYWTKLLCAGLFLGCGVLLRRLCLALELPEETAALAAVLFWFDPIAFFSPMVMGQYDTMCLFLTLWGLCCYAKGQLGRFSMLMGAAMCCKSFPVLLLVPLLLLAEKRLLPLLRWALTALWLWAPTTLLYWGRTGDAAAFTRQMADRLFACTVDLGTASVSVFALGYAVILFVCFLYTPAAGRRGAFAMYVCLAVYGWMFLFVWWHPQWLILLVPFLIVTTLQCGETRPWFWLDLALYAGYFLTCFLLYPDHVGAVLLDGGAACHVFGLRLTGAVARGAGYFLGLLIPYMHVFASALFYGSILLHLLLKLPLPGGSLARRLGKQNVKTLGARGWCAARFAVGLGCCWFLPMLLEALNATGVI